MKYLLALDIDGTITDKHHLLPKETADFFYDLSLKGASFAFLTGRSFTWGYQILKNLQFPYIFSVQNGAITLKMPQGRIIQKKYLNKKILPLLDEISKSTKTDYILYTGYENQDACFYRPKRFGKFFLDYLKQRAIYTKENWISVNSFEEITEFASVKFFGTHENADEISRQLQHKLGLNAPVITDPYNKSERAVYVIQGTDNKVDKGFALRDIVNLIGPFDLVIGAGDDVNDISLLKESTIKIVMDTAPAQVKELATLISPPAAEQGIIPTLKKVLSDYT